MTLIVEKSEKKNSREIGKDVRQRPTAWEESHTPAPTHTDAYAHTHAQEEEEEDKDPLYRQQQQEEDRGFFRTFFFVFVFCLACCFFRDTFLLEEDIPFFGFFFNNSSSRSFTRSVYASNNSLKLSFHFIESCVYNSSEDRSCDLNTSWSLRRDEWAD